MNGWRDRAACLDADPGIFFPRSVDDHLEAVALCHGCPVQHECLAHALTAPERDGIWGGKTEDERRSIRRDATPPEGDRMTRRLDTHADAWRAHTLRLATDVQTAILDQIDCGASDDAVTPRCQRCRTTRRRCARWPRCSWPTQAEQRATERADGNYEPTPAGTSRRAGVSDPTIAATLAWERDVQHATTLLYAAVTAAVDIADSLALVPIDEHGRTLRPPREPATRRTLSGRPIIDIDPPACRTAALDGLNYVRAVTDQLADRLHRADADAADGTQDRAHTLTIALVHAARTLGATTPPAEPDEPLPEPTTGPCACDHTECPHAPGSCPKTVVVGKEATCGTCRHRKAATRRHAS